MTKSQEIHHTEQMEAARAEFIFVWRAVKKVRFSPQKKESQLIDHELTAWNTFLVTKGLKK